MVVVADTGDCGCCCCADVVLQVKAVWKFSTEQTLEELAEQIADTKASFLGEFKLKYGVGCDAKRHLDIHLVRIKFLEIMNLPTNFAYNE
jgi:hypothetical protein